MATKMFVMHLLNMELMYQVCKDSNTEFSSNADRIVLGFMIPNINAYHENVFGYVLST